MKRINTRGGRGRACAVMLWMWTLGACAPDATDAPADKVPGRAVDAARDGGAREPSAEDISDWLDAIDDEPDAAVVTTHAVNQTFWFTGWKVTLGTAEIEHWSDSATLTLHATFENLLNGSSRKFGDSRLDSEITLSAGGKYYDLHQLDAPSLPSARTGEGALKFVVPNSIDLESATITVGVPEYEQAQVPLGPRGDALISLEPTVLDLSGQKLTAGSLTATCKDVVVMANAERFQMASGKRRLVVHFGVELDSSRRGYMNVSWDNFKLSLPDGRTVGAEVGSASDLLYPGDVVADWWAAFTVPEEFAGSYVFAVLTSDKDVPAGKLPFALP